MDLLESLAEVDVPPVPTAPEFSAGVRRKLHPRLLAAHVAGFALLALPWAAVQFVTVVLAAVRYSVTGTWPSRRGSAARGPEGDGGFPGT